MKKIPALILVLLALYAPSVRADEAGFTNRPARVSPAWLRTGTGWVPANLAIVAKATSSARPGAARSTATDAHPRAVAAAGPRAAGDGYPDHRSPGS